MKVPLDLLADDIYSGKNDEIYVVRYSENKPHKIYTQLHENLLVIVLQGKKRVKCHNFDKVIAQGEFGFFKKGNYVMNQILNDCKERYESLLIFIGDDYIKDFHSSIIKKSSTTCNKSHYKGQASSKIIRETESVLELIADKDHLSKEILRLKIKELLLYIAMNDKNNEFIAFMDSCKGKREDFRTFVEENYDRYTDIQGLANAYCVSLSTLKRNFNELYGISPGKWINHKRMEKASNLLMITDYSVTEISYIVGFESISTFMAQFKNEYGMTPGTYRKMSLIHNN